MVGRCGGEGCPDNGRHGEWKGGPGGEVGVREMFPVLRLTRMGRREYVLMHATEQGYLMMKKRFNTTKKTQNDDDTHHNANNIINNNDNNGRAYEAVACQAAWCILLKHSPPGTSVHDDAVKLDSHIFFKPTFQENLPGKQLSIRSTLAASSLLKLLKLKK